MRNLKKILAMVLALVMSLSLMATAGAAQFPDVDDSNPYKTAIDVLDELKVFQGFEDGTFKPTDTLNRAQAAVLVYRIATGDVENKYLDNYTYMQQSKFTDLDGYNWAKGYINYCQNAGIVVGTSATTFNPGAPVTGYQLMVMLLRTLGYGKAGEFTDPKGWELQTAAIAEREGILKNVTGGDFGAPAPRQMVAEILFRGILHDTVEYSPLTPGGYTDSGVSLGKKTLGLEEVKGVVVANEYADLRDDDTLADGKTALVNGDGDTYTIDYTSTLDDIGEARLVYVQNGTKVLKLADAGNTVEVSTNDEKVDDILSRAGISKADADEYINFGKGFNWKSPWKIKYVIDLGKVDDATDSTDKADGLIRQANRDGFIVPDTYSKANGYSIEKVKDADGNTEYHLIYTAVFAIKADITAEHQNNIKRIFNIADKTDSYITGEVYAGTKSTEDLSDKITLDTFIEEYITADALESVSKNENGNWVKVIDNNGDGKADYIFKVIYTVAQVSTAKDGKYTLDTKNRTLTNENTSRPCSIDDLNNLTGQKVVSADELNADDVVYYAIIDGKAQTYLAEVVPGVTIEKYVRKTETVTTTDGTDYIKSGVCEHIEDEAYMSAPELLAGKVSYDLFLDRGGHLAAFVKSDKTSDYKLITDGWFNSTKTADEYAVRVYDEESERGDKQEIVDITANGSLFIDRDVVNNDHTVDNNDWGALKYLGGTTGRSAQNDFIPHASAACTPATLNGGSVTCTNSASTHSGVHTRDNEIKTTVAAITADGTILPVENSSVTGRYNHAMIDLPDLSKVPTKAAVDGVIYKTSVRSDTAYDTEGSSNVTVRALDNTVYYVVYPAATVSGVAVEKSVGYANAPAVKDWNDKGWVEDIYTVGTARKADNDIDATPYEVTADIVVIELNDYENSKETILVLDDVTKLSDVRYRELLVITGDGKQEIRKIDWANSTLSYGDSIIGGKQVLPGLYYMTAANSDGIYRIAGRLTRDQIAADGSYAVGCVERVNWTGGNKYVVVQNLAYMGDNVDYADAGEGQYDLTAETPLFRVEYDTPMGRYGDADLTGLEDGEDHTTVLASQVDRENWDFDYPEMRDTHEGTGHNLHYYNYNRVLVHHNDKGAAVYAVSFANVYDDSEGEYNFAMQVWDNVMPNPASKGNNVKVVAKTPTTVASEDFTITFGNDTFDGNFYTKDKEVKITIEAPFGYTFQNDNDNQITVADVDGGTGVKIFNREFSTDKRTVKLTVTGITKDIIITADLAADTAAQCDVTVKDKAGNTSTALEAATKQIDYNTQNPLGYEITLQKVGGGTLTGIESINIISVKYGDKELTKNAVDGYSVNADSTKITLGNIGDAKIIKNIEIVAEIVTRNTWTASVSTETGGQLKAIADVDLTFVSAKASGGESDGEALTPVKGTNTLTFQVPMGSDLEVVLMAANSVALHAYGDVANVESSDAGHTGAAYVTLTVPYVEAASEQAVIVADWASYSAKSNNTATALGNVSADLTSAAKTLDEAYEILEAGTGEAATMTVKGEVTNATFGDGAEIVDSDEESGLYIVKATAEDKSVAYYVIKVEAAPSAPVGEGNPLGTNVEDENILFTAVSEPDAVTGAVTYSGKVKAGANATDTNKYAFDVEVDAQYKIEDGDNYNAVEKAATPAAVSETKTWTITVTAADTASGAAIATDIDFELTVVPREFVTVTLAEGAPEGVSIEGDAEQEWTAEAEENGLTFTFKVTAASITQDSQDNKYKVSFGFTLSEGYEAALTETEGWTLANSTISASLDSEASSDVTLTITVTKTAANA